MVSVLVPGHAALPPPPHTRPHTPDGTTPVHPHARRARRMSRTSMVWSTRPGFALPDPILADLQLHLGIDGLVVEGPGLIQHGL